MTTENTPTGVTPNPYDQGPTPMGIGQSEQATIKVPNTTEFINSVWDGVAHGTIPELFSAAKTEYLNHFTDSPVLTKEQHQSLMHGRPGLTLSPGTTQSAAKYLTGQYDTARTNNIILANGNKDFEGRMTQDIGSLMGYAADPVGLGAGIGAKALVGFGRAETATLLMARAAQKAQLGLVEGAAFSTPAAAAGLLNDEARGNVDSNEALNAQLGIGETMFMGGAGEAIGHLIHPHLKKRITPEQEASNPNVTGDVADILDSHEPIGSDAANAASEAAIGQLMNGKDVQVAPILQNGAAIQDAKLRNNIESTGATTDQVVDSLNEHQIELNKKLATSNAETSLETLNSRLNQAILQKSDLPEDLRQSLSQQPVEDAGMGIPQMSDHLDNEIDTLNKKSQILGLDPDEQDQLTQLTKKNTDLKSWINETQNLDSIPDPEIRDAKQSVQVMQQQLEQAKLQPELSDDLFNQKLTEMESKINDLNSVVKNVKDKDVFPTEKLKQLIQENTQLRNQSASIDNVRDSLVNPTQPINHEDYKQYLTDMHKPSGNFKDSIPIPEYEETKDVGRPKNLLNERFPESRQKELLKDAKLSPEELEDQAEIDNQEKINKMRKQFIKAANNCILGNP